MPPSLQVGPMLTHAGSGRRAQIGRAETLVAAEPIRRDAERYVLLTASEREDAIISVQQARRWLEAGAAYVCSWGPGASATEESFDYASFLPEFGEPLQYTVMTTSHDDETLEQALWFAFWCAGPPGDHLDPISLVLVLLDSSTLEARCTEWIKTNRS
jgi:hypothetical protein